jgi:hypothetical protein
LILQRNNFCENGILSEFPKGIAIPKKLLIASIFFFERSQC